MATDDCFAVTYNSLAAYFAAIAFPDFPELWIEGVHDAVGGAE